MIGRNFSYELYKLRLFSLKESQLRERERMEEKQGEVVLFGTWASSPCARVELALKLKGIPYEYVEEDLKNKSELLLRHNPVHKKVPVLVHNGKSIAESLIILEYIEECWNTTPKLLPEDPHQRAKVRFWANYYDQKVGSLSLSLSLSHTHTQFRCYSVFFFF